MTTPIAIDPWAFEVAKRLGDEFGLRSPEIYPDLLRAREIATPEQSEEAIRKVCELAWKLEWTYKDTTSAIAEYLKEGPPN